MQWRGFDLRLYTIFSYGVRLFPIHFLHTLHLFYLPPPKKEEKEWNTVLPINDFDHWLTWLRVLAQRTSVVSLRACPKRCPARWKKHQNLIFLAKNH